MPDRKTQRVLDFYNSQFDESLNNFIEDRNWSQEPGFIERLFKDELTESDKNYLRDSLQSLRHKRDSRSSKEYGLELVKNWFIEDVVAEKLSEQDFEASLTGEDSDREFLESTTTQHDLEVLKSGEKFRIEIITDFNGFWQESGLADLRDNKYEKWSQRENSVLLGLDLENQEFFLLTPENAEAERTRDHPVWNKPAYRIDITDVKFRELDNLKEELTNFLENI